MTLYDTVFRRKSCRSYDMTPLSAAVLEDIAAYFAGCTPLFPDIRVKLIFETPDHIDCVQPWRAPHYAVLYTQDHPLNYENLGYLGQLLDLYLQANGIGCCWLGLGRLDDAKGLPKVMDGLQFAIMLAFGTPKDDLYRDLSDFKRKSMEDITDTADPRLEAVRLAPSAVNSQPWYFIHENDLLHVYRTRFDPVRQRMIGKYNRFDTGIALAHLAVAHPGTFALVPSTAHPTLKGHDYILSCKI